MTIASSAFDSEHYGVRIGRLDGLDDDLTQQLAIARDAGFSMVTVRLDATDPGNKVLSAAGHAPLDVLVTSELARDAVWTVPAASVTRHQVLEVPNDVARVEEIGSTAITTSHLHADPRLPVERTRALFRAWTRNDVTGRAQSTFVAREAGVIGGFLTAVVRDDHAAIDLVAVAPEYQGRGLGAQLVSEFIRWAVGHSWSASVGTQETNPALRLYARHGFRPASKHLTYHLWL